MRLIINVFVLRHTWEEGDGGQFKVWVESTDF